MAQLTASDIFTDSRDPGTNVNPKVLGSLWINYNTGEQFVCKDNTLNKNVWVSSTKVIREDLDKLEDSINDQLGTLETVINGTGRFYHGLGIQSERLYYDYGLNYYKALTSISMSGFYISIIKVGNTYYLYYKKQSMTKKYIENFTYSVSRKIQIPNPPIIGRFNRYMRNNYSTESIEVVHPIKITTSGSNVINAEFAEMKPNGLYFTGVTPGLGLGSLGTLSNKLHYIWDCSIGDVLTYPVYRTAHDNDGQGG